MSLYRVTVCLVGGANIQLRRVTIAQINSLLAKLDDAPYATLLDSEAKPYARIYSAHVAGVQWTEEL